MIDYYEYSLDFITFLRYVMAQKSDEVRKRMNKTKFAKAASAVFTGHRFYNFSQKKLIKERLTKAILEAYKHGISNFISGFAIGIDLMAAQNASLLIAFYDGREKGGTFYTFKKANHLCIPVVNVY